MPQTHWSRFSVLDVVRHYYKSLVPRGHAGIRTSGYMLLFVLPLLAGVAAGTFLWIFPGTVNFIPIVTTLGVLVAAFLTTFVAMLNLRAKRADDTQRALPSQLDRAISQTAVACLYQVVVCLGSLGVSVVFIASSHAIAPYGGVSIGVGILTVMLVHASVVTLSLVRRVFLIYANTFSKDFAPDLSAVSDHRRSGT